MKREEFEPTNIVAIYYQCSRIRTIHTIWKKKTEEEAGIDPRRRVPRAITTHMKDQDRHHPAHEVKN